MRRRSAAFLVALVMTLFTAGAGHGLAAVSPTGPGLHRGTPAAEIFATDNTAVITDPDDPRLKTRLIPFAREVRRIVRSGGGVPLGSTLLDGVFWSSAGQYVTYERSRNFDVDGLDELGLRHIARLVRKEFHQKSVLTFRHLPRTSSSVDAVRVEVPGIDVRRLYQGLVADPVVRDRLGGGSVTLDDRLILVADVADLSLVRRFVTTLGSDWRSAGLQYGDWEFVS
ncbi:MAG TPA: hypothetical protein VGP70_27995 [Actinomadura sp.]|nr:hypothetical protein [Actinomadura sp.]